jgi:hypothetical protein
VTSVDLYLAARHDLLSHLSDLLDDLFLKRLHLQMDLVDRVLELQDLFMKFLVHEIYVSLSFTESFDHPDQHVGLGGWERLR